MYSRQLGVYNAVRLPNCNLKPVIRGSFPFSVVYCRLNIQPAIWSLIMCARSGMWAWDLLQTPLLVIPVRILPRHTPGPHTSWDLALAVNAFTMHCCLPPHYTSRMGDIWQMFSLELQTTPIFFIKKKKNHIHAAQLVVTQIIAMLLIASHVNQVSGVFFGLSYK